MGGGVVERTPLSQCNLGRTKRVISHHSSMYLLHGKRAKQQQKAAWIEFCSTVRSLSLFKKKQKKKKNKSPFVYRHISWRETGAFESSIHPSRPSAQRRPGNALAWRSVLGPTCQPWPHLAFFFFCLGERAEG